MSHRDLRFDISRQPDDTTCGPTCLQAVYRYFGDDPPLADVIEGVDSLAEGGTLGAILGCHALRRGYRARLYTYNVELFDPTWFGLDRHRLAAKLREQIAYKKDLPRSGDRLELGARAYLEFLELGGELRFVDLSRRLLHRLLDDDLPVLTGLSATYLYRMVREHGVDCVADDVRGLPVGHFVVLCGYEERARRVLIADPLHPNPLAETRIYQVDADRLINAILLGVLTYDANLLQIEPAPGTRRRKESP